MAMTRVHPLLQRSFLALTLSMVPWVAQAGTAGLEVCGDVDIEVDAQCEVWVEVECDTHCAPIEFELTCSEDLWKICDGMCSASIDLDCTESCTQVCVPDCELDPGNFSCEGRCELDCQASCDAHCAGQTGSAHCSASCEAACSGRCSIGCEGQLPELSCGEKCGDVCGSRCEAEANFDCQVKCQAPRFDSCQAELSGGCKTQCEGDGALFCDGRFIDHGGRLDACVDALEAYLKSKVKVHGHADADCEDGTCHAEVGGGISCDCRAAQGDGPSAWWSASLLALLGLRRRRS